MRAQKGCDLVRLAGNFVNKRYPFASWATPSDVRDGLRLLGYNVTKADHNHETVERELMNYLYFNMNWGWGNGKNNGWFAFQNVNSGSGNFKYSRKDLYITKP